MKKALLFCLFALCLHQLGAQTENVKVGFKVIISINDTIGKPVYITGNFKKLGNWKPDEIKLKRLNDITYFKEFNFPRNSDIEFKFTRGTWQKEALDTTGFVLSNFHLKVEQDTVITKKIFRWGNRENVEASGQITGDVRYIDSLKTREELLPRDIIIWLPPEYEEQKNKRYPVLYMHDGQNIIDPATSSFGVDWQIDETADSLIRKGVIEPIIIVGMYCTSKRFTEYSENDTGYAYIDFIVEDLKPIIDKCYRTKTDKKNTAIAGSSMGGLISFMAAWERPDVFSKAACLSPAFKIRSYDFVDNVNNYEGDRKDILLYIDNGGIALDDSLQPGADAMLDALEEKGFSKNEDYFWYKDKDAVHNEVAWAERAWRFLTLFFGKDN